MAAMEQPKTPAAIQNLMRRAALVGHGDMFVLGGRNLCGRNPLLAEMRMEKVYPCQRRETSPQGATSVTLGAGKPCTDEVSAELRHKFSIWKMSVLNLLSPKSAESFEAQQAYSPAMTSSSEVPRMARHEQRDAMSEGADT